MVTKAEYTEGFLKAADMQATDEEIAKQKVRWWLNIRDDGGLRLTEEGTTFLITELKLESYDIRITRDVRFTPENLLILDHFISCPYYINKRKHMLVLFGEVMAAEMAIYNKDIAYFFENYKNHG